MLSVQEEKCFVTLKEDDIFSFHDKYCRFFSYHVIITFIHDNERPFLQVVF